MGTGVVYVMIGVNMKPEQGSGTCTKGGGDLEFPQKNFFSQSMTQNFPFECSHCGR